MFVVIAVPSQVLFTLASEDFDTGVLSASLVLDARNGKQLLPDITASRRYLLGLLRALLDGLLLALGLLLDLGGLHGLLGGGLLGGDLLGLRALGGLLLGLGRSGLLGRLLLALLGLLHQLGLRAFELRDLLLGGLDELGVSLLGLGDSGVELGDVAVDGLDLVCHLALSCVSDFSVDLPRPL